MDVEAWKMSRSQWKHSRNIHEPWVGEISPAQRGLMSQRARSAYDAKRVVEWDASEAGSAEYRRLVLEAHAQGSIPEGEASADAQAEIRWHETRERERESASRAAMAHERNVCDESVEAGSKVYLAPFGYGRVVRVSRLSIRVQFDGGFCQTGPRERFSKLSPADLKAATA